MSGQVSSRHPRYPGFQLKSRFLGRSPGIDPGRIPGFQVPFGISSESVLFSALCVLSTKYWLFFALFIRSLLFIFGKFIRKNYIFQFLSVITFYRRKSSRKKRPSVSPCSLFCPNSMKWDRRQNYWGQQKLWNFQTKFFWQLIDQESYSYKTPSKWKIYRTFFCFVIYNFSILVWLFLWWNFLRIFVGVDFLFLSDLTMKE